MIIAIDFDNTIIEPTSKPYNLKTYIFKSNCKETILKLAKNNKLYVNSARYLLRLIPMIKFIKKNKLPLKFSFRKPYADIYIDDKNIYCKEINWKKIYDYIKDINN